MILTLSLSGIAESTIKGNANMQLALRKTVAEVLSTTLANVGAVTVTAIINTMALRVRNTGRRLAAKCTVSMKVTSALSAAQITTLTSGTNAAVAFKDTFVRYYTKIGGSVNDLSGVNIEGLTAVSADSAPTSAPTANKNLAMGLGLGLGLGGGLLAILTGLYYRFVYLKKKTLIGGMTLSEKVAPMQDASLVMVKTGAAPQRPPNRDIEGASLPLLGRVSEGSDELLGGATGIVPGAGAGLGALALPLAEKTGKVTKSV